MASALILFREGNSAHQYRERGAGPVPDCDRFLWLGSSDYGGEHQDRSHQACIWAAGRCCAMQSAALVLKHALGEVPRRRRTHVADFAGGHIEAVLVFLQFWVPYDHEPLMRRTAVRSATLDPACRLRCVDSDEFLGALLPCS